MTREAVPGARGRAARAGRRVLAALVALPLAIPLAIAFAAGGEEGDAGAADPVAVQSAADAVQGHLLAEVLILFGCVFILSAAMGMLRFPDFYTRLHASTKVVTLGGIGVFGGAALAFSAVQATGRVLLIAVFFFLTAPVSGYMIARSGYLRGLKQYREDSSVDEWDACGAAAPEDDGQDELEPASGAAS